MGDRWQVQRKTFSNSSSPPVHKSFSWQRPFTDPLYNSPVQRQLQTMPDLQAQLEQIKRAAPDMSRVKVNNTTPAVIQPKLTVGEPGDKHEQEADRVAAQVMTQMNSPQTQQQGQTIQRQEMQEDEALSMKPEAGTIQREEIPQDDEEQKISPKLMVQRQPTEGGMTATADLESQKNPTSNQSATQTDSGDRSMIQERIQAFIEKHNDHAHLLEGFEDGMSETQIISKLIENFHNRNDFDYNFSRSSAFTHQGDCGVLVQEFITIAQECFGIQNIQSEKGNRGYFIPGGGKIVHKDNQTGNIDQGKHWFFEEHVWAVWDGKPIDVLFGQFGIVSHIAGVSDKYDPNEGTVRYTVGNVVFFPKQGSQSTFDRYTTDPNKMMRLGQRK